MIVLAQATAEHAAFFPGQEGNVRSDLKASEWASIAFLDGDPLAMVGVAMINGWAMPWLYVTALACHRPVTFWRACKVVFRDIRGAYPQMVQVVRPAHESWARRLGFTLGDMVTMDGQPVRQIRIDLLEA
jgi:hypothetical protein